MDGRLLRTLIEEDCARYTQYQNTALAEILHEYTIVDAQKELLREKFQQKFHRIPLVIEDTVLDLEPNYLHLPSSLAYLRTSQREYYYQKWTYLEHEIGCDGATYESKYHPLAIAHYVAHKGGLQGLDEFLAWHSHLIQQENITQPLKLLPFDLRHRILMQDLSYMRSIYLQVN